MIETLDTALNTGVWVLLGVGFVVFTGHEIRGIKRGEYTVREVLRMWVKSLVLAGVVLLVALGVGLIVETLIEVVL